MLSLFKKSHIAIPASSQRSRAFPLASELSDKDLIHTILNFCPQNKPVVNSQLLVALENLPFRFTSFLKMSRKSMQYLTTMDGFVTFILDEYAQHQGDTLEDEINSRRWFYFYIAALLTVAYDRARENPSLWDDIADIWSILMKSAHSLRASIDQTSLWSPHEIITFDGIESKEEGEEFVNGTLA